MGFLAETTNSYKLSIKRLEAFFCLEMKLSSTEYTGRLAEMLQQRRRISNDTVLTFVFKELSWLGG